MYIYTNFATNKLENINIFRLFAKKVFQVSSIWQNICMVLEMIHGKVIIEL